MGNQSIKAQTIEKLPPTNAGWQPMGLRVRALSQLDASTGRLTQDQIKAYADLPQLPQPERGYPAQHLLARGSDQSVSYYSSSGGRAYPRSRITVEGALKA